VRLERGDIYFFYRPRVEHESAQGLEDVQRFHLVLKPDSGPFRLITVGRKRLPEIRDRERNWAYVEKVARSPEEISAELARYTYETKTRGERVQPEARPAGEGVYAIVRHDKHTHLAYELDVPRSEGPVQRELKIEPRASYIVTVRNPERPWAGVPEYPITYPPHLQSVFRGRRFAELDPPELLDFEGTDLVLIGASDQPDEELGLHLEPEHETEETAEIFRDLHVERVTHATLPLFGGEWR
jgi:hypothetical protein